MQINRLRIKLKFVKFLTIIIYERGYNKCVTLKEPRLQLALTIYNIKKELEMEKGNTWKVKGKYV